MGLVEEKAATINGIAENGQKANEQPEENLSVAKWCEDSPNINVCVCVCVCNDILKPRTHPHYVWLCVFHFSQAKIAKRKKGYRWQTKDSVIHSSLDERRRTDQPTDNSALKHMNYS